MSLEKPIGNVNPKISFLALGLRSIFQNGELRDSFVGTYEI